jgi:hypothetical protein
LILVIQIMYLLPSGSEDTGKTILLYIYAYLYACLRLSQKPSTNHFLIEYRAKPNYSALVFLQVQTNH